MKNFIWKPKEDITAWELAQALRPWVHVMFDPKTFEKLPDSVKRHYLAPPFQPPATRSQGRLEKWLRVLEGRIACLFSFHFRRFAPSYKTIRHRDEHQAEGQTAITGKRQ